MSALRLSDMPLVLTYGPGSVEKRFGHIVVPALNALPSAQPSYLLSFPESWWTRQRKYAFVFVAGLRNPRMRGSDGRRFRRFFMQETTKYNNTVGDKPFLAQDLASLPDEERAQVTAHYRDSIFCPVLAGDDPWQRRFTDVMFMGCLPLVLSFEKSNRPGGKTWFDPTRDLSVGLTYPFHPALYGHDAMTAVDYDSFVVEVPGNRVNEQDMSKAKSVMENLMCDPEALKAKQLAMRSWVVSQTYGLGQDAHVYEDAFA